MIAPAKRLDLVGEYYFSRKLEEIRQMQASGLKVINLGIGSPDQPPPPEAVEGTVASLRAPDSHGYASYRCTPRLREAMAAWYLKTFGVKADPATEILPLLGSKEGIMYASLAYLNPGDGVLVPDPGYPAYASVAKLIGATPVFYDLAAETDWMPDWKALERLDLSRVRMMWVNYPNMPTGRDASPELFERLAAFGRERGILIAHDNPYSLVLAKKPLSILAADPGKQHCLELNSLSKAFNMAGWRVGMLVGSEACVNAVLQVKSNADSGMFLPIQRGAEAAFGASAEWHARRNETYAARQKAAFRIFDILGFSYDPKQVGMFAWAKAPDKIPEVEAFLDGILKTKHVFITPGMIFGSNGLRYGRISLCAPVEVLEEAARRLRGGGGPA